MGCLCLHTSSHAASSTWMTQSWMTQHLQNSCCPCPHTSSRAASFTTVSSTCEIHNYLVPALLLPFLLLIVPFASCLLACVRGAVLCGLPAPPAAPWWQVAFTCCSRVVAPPPRVFADIFLPSPQSLNPLLCHSLYTCFSSFAGARKVSCQCVASWLWKDRASGLTPACLP